MNTPKISVVIPVYNVENFLRQCLDSVLMQPMRDIEIICVNDGSTDSSPQILEEYSQKDSRIRVIHQPNLHSGIARNNGLEAACGEYIHFLDSDDYLTDNAYEETYRIAHEFNLDYLKAKAYAIDAFSGELITAGIAGVYQQNMMSQEDYERPFAFMDAPEKLTTAPVYAPWCGMYRREYLMDNNIRFDDLQSFDDHSFYMAAAVRAERVMVADVFMVWHRRNNPNSLVGNYLKRFTGHFESFRIIHEASSFLPPDALALVLDAELISIFSYYRMAITQGVDAENAHKAMYSFIKTFDFSLVKSVFETTRWYSDYLMLKLEAAKADGNTAKQEVADIVSKLKEIRLKNIPIPLEQIKTGSKLVLYGAGNHGRQIYEFVRLLELYDIVLWVDRDWKNLRDKGLSVSDPMDIRTADYDSILIAIENTEVAAKVRNWLIEEFEITKEKIVYNMN